MPTIHRLLICILLSLPMLLKAEDRIKDVKLITHKTGPYIGFSKGRVDYLEFGAEYQRKRNKLKGSVINAVSFGFGYSFRHEYLNYTLSYWRKVGAFGLTFGVDGFGQTNFDRMTWGVSPTIGFRLLGFHLQSGYQFYQDTNYGMTTNQFFVRLRFTFIKNTERNLKR